MNKPASRLHFLDAIRAFAIIMMLQGHFVHSLLSDLYRDTNNVVYATWEYFRGITAPVFFTITGFIFIYLLLKQKVGGLENPRVLKGIKRAVKIIFWGYLLRLSFYSLFTGAVNPSFFYVDVLQCIGTSLLLLIGLYLVLYRINASVFLNSILGFGVIIFLLQPMYGSCILEFLPQTIANYFTNRNGSVFTLLPWFGYVCFGSYMAGLFLKYKEHKNFYSYAIMVLLSLGIILVFFSSAVLMLFYDFTGITIFKSVAYNNFLFIRLGNVCVLFSVFIMLRNYFTSQVLTKIGGKTLSIYILHFFILYGSWFGLGLSRFFYHSLTPLQVLIGALIFVVGICVLVLYYYKYEEELKFNARTIISKLSQKIKTTMPEAVMLFRNDIVRKYRNMRR
ncbi:heparan-alpha-glucosaminide N-acetyltransferase domain-containing protein [Aquimarina sediminis]|uniref:heparan-alpha-glucosaminide N-acetyltransferase domain-containing protein n=1 Tax=Aquimarina sediminis TaxID=2070536 RepID=UPI000CA06B54|nr:heparan-alpha-glucosaminide N-acetyltransferase domain-containing protein [Aquimarina sediminis]